MNQIHSLQEEALHFHDRETNYVKYIRELEQKTEDLEKLQRFVQSTLKTFCFELLSTTLFLKRVL